MLKSKKMWIGIASVVTVALVVVLGVAAFTVVNTFAQAPTPTTTPNQSAPNQNGKMQVYENLFLNNLASKLGTTVDKLKTAIVGAFNDTVDQAVKDGAITQSQGDTIKNKADQSVQNGQLPGFFGGFFGHRGFMGRGFRGDYDLISPAELAKALNMTQSDLMTALQSGKTIADIAKSQNIDLAQVKTTVLNDAKTQLDQQVTNGNLTQSQADQIYNQLSTKFDTLATRVWTGGMHHFWKGNPPTQQNPNSQNQLFQNQNYDWNQSWQ